MINTREAEASRQRTGLSLLGDIYVASRNKGRPSGLPPGGQRDGEGWDQKESSRRKKIERTQGNGEKTQGKGKRRRRSTV